MSTLLFRVDRALSGWPDGLLTALLLLLAGALVVLAVCARPSVKAAAVAWVVFP